jgi:hypothetical protein
MAEQQKNQPDSFLPNYVYVASSWRNPLQIAVCTALRSAGIDHYDFKNPTPGHEGFHWSEVGMPSYDRTTNSSVPADEYLAGMQHPAAIAGFERDMAAMSKADTFVLVQPCGRSAHLELGWAAGMGKRTFVLLEDPCVPDLMYRMCDGITPSLMDLLAWLGVED